jgi:hypothetical protein
VFLVLFPFITPRFQNNSIGVLDRARSGGTQLHMHRKNVPEMPLMITRTTVGGVKRGLA